MIVIKSPSEIERMAEACLIVSETLKKVSENIGPGVTTQELDRIAESHITGKGAKPAFKGYRGYPATLCISVNEEVVHGIPGSRSLKAGDVVSVDVGVILNGFFGDAAFTIIVGEGSDEAKRLVQVTERSLQAGIEKAVAGNRLSDISSEVQRVVEGNGFSVVRDFVGHGIGRELHEDPQIPNFGRAGLGPVLREGMTLAIEPMVNAGVADIRILPDKWTAVTADGRPSAHFEHTVAVTKDGPRILTIN